MAEKAQPVSEREKREERKGGGEGGERGRDGDLDCVGDKTL